MSLLELKNVSKIYGELHALDKVSLAVNKGEWVSIMGPSGSGKSTMMNIIGCMDKPTEGEVLLDGVDIAKESAKNLTTIRRDKIGLIFQQFHLVNYLTAVENVMLADEPTGNLDEANEEIVVDLFHKLHDEGTTLIVVTHDPEVAEVAQRTLVLRSGKLAKEVVNEHFTGKIRFD